MSELPPDPYFLVRSALLCLLVVVPFGAYLLLVRRRVDYLRGKPLLLDPVAYLFIATAGVVITKTGSIIALGRLVYELPFLHEHILGAQTTTFLNNGYFANMAFVYPFVLALVLLARTPDRRGDPSVSPPGRLRRLADRGLCAPALSGILALALGLAVAVLLYFLFFDLEIGNLQELSAKRFLNENREANPDRFYSLRYVAFKLAGLPKIIGVVALAAYLFATRRRSLLTLALMAIAAFFLYGVMFSVRAHLMLFSLEMSVLLALARPRRWRLAVVALLASSLLVSGMVTVLRMKPNKQTFFATRLREAPADAATEPRPADAKRSPAAAAAGTETETTGTETPTTGTETETTGTETETTGTETETTETETPTTGTETETTETARAPQPSAKPGRSPTPASTETSVYNFAVRVTSLRYFSDISKLAVIIDRWDADHPWLYGETLYSWVTLPLGDTPLLTFAELGRLLGEEVFHLRRSGVTPGLIGELYVNFSWLGIVFGGLLLGALAWRFQLWTDRRVASPLPAALLSLSVVKVFLLLLNGTLGSTVLNLSLDFLFVALLAILSLVATRLVPQADPVAQPLGR